MFHAWKSSNARWISKDDTYDAHVNDDVSQVDKKYDASQSDTNKKDGKDALPSDPNEKDGATAGMMKMMMEYQKKEKEKGLQHHSLRKQRIIKDLLLSWKHGQYYLSEFRETLAWPISIRLIRVPFQGVLKSYFMGW